MPAAQASGGPAVAVQAPGRFSLAARLTALALFSLIGLLLLEGAVRVRQYIKYGSTKNALYETIFDPASQLTIPKPGQTTRTIQIDSRGFRSPEVVAPKPPGTIRIAFLGASTTFCAEVSGNEAAWPHLVWKQLQAKWPNIRFDYVNASMPGYIVESSKRNLEHRVKPLRPDIIVLYEGINDLSRDARRLAESQGILRGSVDESSGLGRWLLTWSLLEKNIRLLARRNAAREGTRQLTFHPPELSKAFHVRLKELVDDARATAPIVALATISQKVRPGQSPEEQLRNANTHLYYMPYLGVDGILRGFDEYNRVIRQVARETGALLIEDENAIPGDDRHFNDSVHFKDAGSVLMAQRVAGALLSSGTLEKLFPAPASRAAARPN
jgi:lysophospholipase L1-like esterase